MPSSARGSALGFWCDRSLCTLDKRLSRRRVCSPLRSVPMHWASANARSEANFLLQTLHTQALLNGSSVVQCRLEEMHRFHYLSPSFLVPHHANPKGSFQVGWWRTREYCHGFPRIVQVLLHSHKPLGRERWLPSPNGQHRHQSCRSRPDSASQVPQPTSHQYAVERRYFQCSTDLKIAQRVLVSLKTRSASYPAHSAVVHRSNNPKGAEGGALCTT